MLSAEDSVETSAVIAIPWNAAHICSMPYGQRCLRSYRTTAPFWMTFIIQNKNAVHHAKRQGPFHEFGRTHRGLRRAKRLNGRSLSRSLVAALLTPLP